MSRRMEDRDFQIHLQDVSYLAICRSLSLTAFFQLGDVKNGAMGRLLLRGQDPSHRLGSPRTSQ
jgi:hypothetical protein